MKLLNARVQAVDVATKLLLKELSYWRRVNNELEIRKLERAIKTLRGMLN